MRRIPQRHDWDCLVASLSMVLGITYDNTVAKLAAVVARRPEDPAFCSIEAEALMFQEGYALVRAYHLDPVRQKLRPEWPPRPFAPVHICYVHATKGPHACAMDSEGRVYDPFTAERLTLAHPDYQSIDHVDGFFKVK